MRPAALFEISEFPQDVRTLICANNIAACNTLCNVKKFGAAQTNTCDATLDYRCVCYNGIHPFLKNYTTTVESFVCEENKRRGCGEGTGAGNVTVCHTCPTTPPQGLDISDSIEVESAGARPSPLFQTLMGGWLLLSAALYVLSN